VEHVGGRDVPHLQALLNLDACVGAVGANRDVAVLMRRCLLRWFKGRSLSSGMRRGLESSSSSTSQTRMHYRMSTQLISPPPSAIALVGSSLRYSPSHPNHHRTSCLVVHVPRSDRKTLIFCVPSLGW
jgi:hypothetical protein